MGAWQRAVRGDQHFTLRILREDLAGRDDARQVLLEEIRRTATIRHAALLLVHAKDVTSSRPWMLTDSIEGPTLARFLAERGPQPEPTALGFALRITQALAHLEERSQVHIDVRPERVLHAGGGWKLWTFREIRATDELGTRKGSKPPDARFAPPERAREHGAALCAPALVAWSIGGLLRELVGAGPPCTADGEPCPLPPSLPATLATQLGALLHPDPGQRPQGAAAVERWLRDPQARPTPPTTVALPPAPVRRRRREQ